VARTGFKIGCLRTALVVAISADVLTYYGRAARRRYAGPLRAGIFRHGSELHNSADCRWVCQGLTGSRGMCLEGLPVHSGTCSNGEDLPKSVMDPCRESSRSPGDGRGNAYGSSHKSKVSTYDTPRTDFAFPCHLLSSRHGGKAVTSASG